MQTRRVALRPQPCNPRCPCGTGAALSGSRQDMAQLEEGKGLQKPLEDPRLAHAACSCGETPVAGQVPSIRCNREGFVPVAWGVL